MTQPNPFGAFQSEVITETVPTPGSAATTPLDQVNITPMEVDPNFVYTGAASIPGSGYSNSMTREVGSGTGPKPWDPWSNMPERQAVSMMDERSESPWAKLQRQNAEAKYRQAQGLVGAQSMAGMQSGLNSLAAQGGLTGGGRVAMANQAGVNRVKGTQNLAGKHAIDLRNISGQDIQNQLRQENRESDKQFAADTSAWDNRFYQYNNDQRADSQDRAYEESKPGSAWWQPKNWF